MSQSKQQASLLSFFKKSPSTDTVIKKSISSVRADDSMTTEATLNEEAPLASNPSQSVAPKAVLNHTQSSVTDNNDDEDEELAQRKLYKRLKKCVRIADDDEEETNPKNESVNVTPAKVVTKSTSIEIEYENARSKTPTRSTTPIKTPAAKGKETTKSAQATTAKKTTDKKKPAAKTPSKDMQEEEEGEGELIDIQKNEGKAFDYNDFSDSTPEWAKAENARDSKKKRPGDAGYDPTSLYIPDGAIDKCTPTMKQYWGIKKDNYDKIILFKLGKFYELFYEDALICHKELDLNWMANKMHVGFPEKALERFAFILVNKGYKVCVVEQTETPKQMEERLRQQTSGKKEKLVKREMVQVMSKGTCISPTDTDSEPKVLLAFRCRKNVVSVAFLEVGANVITVGSFTDDENFTMFKTFVSQVRPVEVVYEAIETHPMIIRIVKNCSTNPVLSPLNDPMAWNVMKAYADLEASYGSKDKWPEGLAEVLKMEESAKDQVMLSISGLIVYLKKMLIADTVLHAARFDFYDPNKFQISRMVLDSQALQHLEILEVAYATKSSVEGSLLHYVDKTVSAFGKRLLRKWICAPLLDVDAINDRLDALEDLESLYQQKAEFRKSLQSIPDLERVCGRIYSQSIKKNSNVIMFEDIAGSRLREFKKLLESLGRARNLLKDFEGCQVKSKALKRLFTFENHEEWLEKRSGNMPEITALLDQMATFVAWEGPKKETPVPKAGLDKDYDGYKQQVQEIEEELEDYLKTIRGKFGGSKDVIYAHTKHRYEIEIPTKLVSGNKKPADFEFSSKKADRERFITQFIKDKVEELEEVEEKLKGNLNGFVCFVFSYFYKHHKVWDRFIEGLAQLDCLCSLSMVSFVADGTMCRPELFPANQRVFMDVRDMRHPCVSMNKSNFVSNDIIIGDLEESEINKGLMLLTGPNMGGKSTILRQACIAAILAQLGCYIPATSCRMSLVDRVFTRIGASDKLSEGKSTFFIEMEETVNVLKYGTMNSLAIMDELGRGTSTFDGVAIAYSVVNYIISKLGCRTLFATHYHVLLDEFKENPHISFYHMSSRIEKDRVIFLYKLIQGECSNSFGLNIAKLSGINKEVVNVAKEKADEFEKNLNIREAVRLTKAFNRVLKELESQEDVNRQLDVICEALESLNVQTQ